MDLGGLRDLASRIGWPFRQDSPGEVDASPPPPPPLAEAPAQAHPRAQAQPPAQAQVRAPAGGHAERLAQRFAAPPSAGRPGWLEKQGPPTSDATARFQEAYAAAAAGKNTLPPDAKKYVYLTVPGLFTERYPGYMNDNERRLKELGLDVRRAPIDSDAGVEANAKVVRDAVLEAARSGKQVVLIGHSKGGVDATAALSLYPELKPHVRSMIAMQTPFGGSPIASDIHSSGLRGLAEKAIRTVFRGDPQSLSDISYDSRQAFLAKHPYPTDVPTVSLATGFGGGLSLVAPAAKYVQSRYGEKSDGLVCQRDAEVPGSRVVRLDDMDHAAAAMRGPAGLAKYRPADVTQALVTIALT